MSLLSRPFGGGFPSTSPSKAIEFSDLESLHQHLEQINQYQVASLELYHDAVSNGFYHILDRQVPGDFSKSSTATCVLSLLATDQWLTRDWGQHSELLAEKMLTARWSSAELPVNNVFTTAFILEASYALAAESKKPRIQALFTAADLILQNELKGGFATIEGYPATAYLTQLAVRALDKRNKLPPELATDIRLWAWKEIYHQLALLEAKSKTADPYQLAYSIILIGQLGVPSETKPDEALVLQFALHRLFAEQLPDGSWARSQPLFHYPNRALKNWS